MKQTAKSVMVVGVCLLGVAFVMLNVLAYNHAYAMMHFTSKGGRTRQPESLAGLVKLKVLFTGVNIPRPMSDVQPSAVDPSCREVWIGEPDTIQLAAWYCDRGSHTPLVILFHGYASDKTALMGEAQAFLAMGASILLIDFRGSGGSSESYTTIGVREADDVAAAVRYVQENFSHTSIICFGQSMGAVAILRAIRDDQISPDAVILEAVFDTLLNTVCNRFKSMHVPSFPSAQLMVLWGGWQWRFNGFQHNPVDYAAHLRCPALLMHGADDPRATLEEGRRVFDAASGEKMFQIFPNTGHDSYVTDHRVEWTGAVEKILKRAESNTMHRIDSSH